MAELRVRHRLLARSGPGHPGRDRSAADLHGRQGRCAAGRVAVLHRRPEPGDPEAATVQANVASGYIPYAPTLGQYVTADEAIARYTNLQAWYAARGHFWVGTGPFYLESVYPVEGSLTLKCNGYFSDPSDKWAGFGAPKIATAELTGPGFPGELVYWFYGEKLISVLKVS